MRARAERQGSSLGVAEPTTPVAVNGTSQPVTAVLHAVAFLVAPVFRVVPIPAFLSLIINLAC